jgi:cytoskeletal protein RodZ
LSTNNAKQSGFSPIIGIVAVILVLGILGLIGWRLLAQPTKQTNSATSSNQSTSKTPASNNNQNTTPAKQTDANAGYFVIKEWGVRFKPVSGLTNIEYYLKYNGSRADFTTQEVAQQVPSCNAQNYSTGIESLGRYATNAQNPINATLLTTINGYNYYYGGGQAPCADSTTTSAADENLLNTDSANFRSSIMTLEAAQ